MVVTIIILYNTHLNVVLVLYYFGTYINKIKKLGYTLLLRIPSSIRRQIYLKMNVDKQICFI